MNYSAEIINEKLHSEGIARMVKSAEAKHEAQFDKLLDMINSSHEKDEDFVGAIFITGPSASGKTTFSNRLSRLLEGNGYNAPVISIDDYYRDRDDIHRMELERGMVHEGETSFDYECVEAFDVPFFREQMTEFLHGKTITLPRFDFVSGTRGEGIRTITRENNTMVIVEGIQAMNPAFGENLEFSKEFNIYICPFDGFDAEDGKYEIDTKQLRFLRRSIRDITTRGSSVERTMDMWGAVRAGEEKYIKPMKRYADFFFNSSLEYEIFFYSSRVRQIIKELAPEEAEEYRKILNVDAVLKFAPLAEIPVPEKSIFNEFYVT